MTYGTYTDMLDKNIKITIDNNIFNYEKINYYNSKSHNNDFKKLVLNINYMDKLPTFCDNKFIVYHHRIKNDNAWDQTDQTLEKILKLKNKFKLVIFSRKNIDIKDENIYFTSNLKEYASIINSNNCLAMISVWSGGGQIGSYCNNSKLIMYFDENQNQYSYGLSDDYLQSHISKFINSQNGFDYCQFSNCNRIFMDIKELDVIEKYI